MYNETSPWLTPKFVYIKTHKIQILRGGKFKLTVAIPVYNEKDTIQEVIKRVEQSPVEKEIIIVNDGSDDGTKEVLDSIKEQRKNMGKGQAIKKGFSLSKGDHVIIQDADLEYDPDQYPKLLEPLL